MEIKKHFKMYKSGKQWCVAALATLAITTGGILSTSTAHADTMSAVPSSAVGAVSTNLSANNEAVSASSSANGEAADVSSSSTSSASSSQGSASAEKATTVNVATGTNTSASSAAATAESSNTSSSATTNDDSQPIREVKATVSNTTNARFETKDGKVYYYDAENHMYQNQWYENWGNKYYFGDDGARITSATHDIDGATYYFDNQGIMKSDYFLNQDGKVYYFDKDGKEYKDQFYSNWGNMYYFGKDGARYTNQYYSNWGHTYYFGEGGVRYTDRFYSNDGKLYYFDKKGIRLTNQWYQNWGNKYYFGADGARITSTTHDIDGVTYYFDNQGIMKSDYFLNQGGKVYYFDKDGKEYKDQFYSNWGNMYYFGKDGARYTNRFYQNWGHTYYFGDGGVLLKNQTKQIDGITLTFDKDGIITNTSSVTSVIREQIAKEVAQKLNSDIKWDWTNQSNGYQELALHDLAQLLAQGDANNDGAALAKRLQSDSLLSGEILSSTLKRLNGTPANIAEAFVSQLNATSDQKNGAVVGVGFDLANDQVAIILFKPANEQAVAQVSSSIIAKIAEVYKAAGINSNVEVANGLTAGTTVSASELGSAWQQLNTALLKGTANETIPSDVLQAIFNDLPGNKTALNGTKTYTTANGDQYHYEYWLAGQSADDKLQNFLKENQGAKYGDQLKVNYTATLTWGPASQVTTDTTLASQKTDSQLDLAYQTGSETGTRYDKVTVEKLPGMTEDMIRGVDISSYQALVNAGVQFYDFNGNKAPLFKVLKDADVNWVRIRVWNDPYDKDGNGYGGGNNDEATLVKLATEASQYGLKVLVDFHYSDFWADPAKQPLPKAWKNLSSNDLNQSIYLYTAKVLTDLRNAGANVGMVQVGNEITNGVFGLYSDRDHGGNWRSLWQGKDANQVAQYLATGTSAVRAILPTAKIVLQLETPNIDKYRTIMTVWKNNHVDYDYLGTSYYPFWSTGDNNGTYNGQNLGTGANTPNNLKAIEEMAQNEFGKQVVVLETAWVSTTQDSDGTGNSIGSTSDTSAYPVNPQGQVNALEDMYKALIAGNGVGGFYWEPAWIPVKAGWDNWQFNKEMSNLYGTGWASKYAIGYAPDNVMYYNGQPTWGGTTWDNAALFDDHGHPLQSLMAYAGMLNGYTTPTIEQTSSVNGKVTQIVNKTDATPNDGLTTNAALSITNLISEDGQKLLKGDSNQTISKSVLEQIAKDLNTSSKSQIYTADNGATYHYVYTLDGATADEQVANFVKANANAKYGKQLVADYTATVVVDQEATPLVPTAGEATSPIVVKVGQVWNTVGNGTVNVTNGPKSGDVLTSNDLNLQGISTTAVQKLLTGKKGEAISADALNQVKSLLTNKAVEGTKAYTVDGNNYHYEYWLQSVDQNRTYGSPVTLTYSASLKWDGEIASATASQVASLPSASASSTSQAQTESAVAASQAAATSTAYTTMVATSTSSTSSYTSSLSSSEEAAKE